jgi:CHAT domain-containing protein
MTALYTGLSEGLTLASALRNATLSARAENPHPFYWAAFCQYGNWSTTMPVPR